MRVRPRFVGLLVGVAVALLLRAVPAFAWTDDPLAVKWHYVGAGAVDPAKVPEWLPPTNDLAVFAPASSLWDHFDWTKAEGMASACMSIEGTTNQYGSPTAFVFPEEVDMPDDAAGFLGAGSSTRYARVMEFAIQVGRDADRVPVLPLHLAAWDDRAAASEGAGVNYATQTVDAYTPGDDSHRVGVFKGFAAFAYRPVGGEYEWYRRVTLWGDCLSPETGYRSEVVTGTSASAAAIPHFRFDSYDWDYFMGDSEQESWHWDAVLLGTMHAGETTDSALVDGAFAFGAFSGPPIGVDRDRDSTEPTDSVIPTGSIVPSLPSDPTGFFDGLRTWTNDALNKLSSWLWPITKLNEWGSSS